MDYRLYYAKGSASDGMKIEPLVESINKLSYGDEIDSFIKETLKN